MGCELCGNPLSGAQRRWCSKRCNDRSRYTRRTLPFTCPSCGRQVLIFANKATRQKHCTRSCATATFNHNHLRGERNVMWRGGRVLYYGVGWKTIKIEVRKRDRVCTHCGKTPEENGRALDVHHLEPFRFSGDNSLNNLVALCRSCHMRADDHGRSGAAKFLRTAGAVSKATKREFRRLEQKVRKVEAMQQRRRLQARAFELAVEGHSLRQIARAVGVSHQTVSN